MLYYLFQNKEEIPASYTSQLQEGSRTLGRPLWVLKAAYETLGDITLTHFPSGMEGCQLYVDHRAGKGSAVGQAVLQTTLLCALCDPVCPLSMRVIGGNKYSVEFVAGAN